MKTENKKTCGIIMPISEIEDLTETHWKNVYSILETTLAEIGLECKLVSNGEESNVIHSRIAQNIQNNPIIICDVSAKNPNVMFELGLRIASNKPIIIIKDDKTDFIFDTGIIEHLVYPRDLRYNKVEDFKRILKVKLESILLEFHGNTIFSNHENNLNLQSKFTDLEHIAVNVIKKSFEELKDNLKEIKNSIPTPDHEILKRLEAMGKRNKELEIFLLSLAHEMRKPVATILGLGTLIDNADPEEINKIVSYINESAYELDSIIIKLIEEANINPH